MTRIVRHGEHGQALPLVDGALVAVLIGSLVLGGVAHAIGVRGDSQRAADLAALAGARALLDAYPRVFAPAEIDDRPSPDHLERAEYLAIGRRVALVTARRNGAGDVEVSFLGDALAPLRVRVAVRDRIVLAPGATVGAGATAEAELTPAGASPLGAPGAGEYAGPLEYRQGKPMRPDVADAFDRMAAAAKADGISLVINSAFRSDAEQAELWEQNPDPRWVAPPGQSLHRCATELDLGPPSVYSWLAAHAGEFDFLQRYSWEAWHVGYDRPPAPCSDAGNSVGATRDDGAPPGGETLPGFVPPRFRDTLIQAASKWNVSAALLAGQLMAESNFDPFAESPVGAEGIAQFMPGTAASYGLADPFDPVEAIDAQAHLMSDLIHQFGSPELALAAYNAGPAPVEACHCVPAIPETSAYVARIMALLGGAGALPVPTFEVRLVA